MKTSSLRFCLECFIIRSFPWVSYSYVECSASDPDQELLSIAGCLQSMIFITLHCWGYVTPHIEAWSHARCNASRKLGEVHDKLFDPYGLRERGSGC